MAEKVEIIINAKDNASKVLGGLHNTLSTLATVGAAAAAAAVVAVGGALVDSVKAAMEAEDNQAQLAAVLKSTGGAAGMTSDAINALAADLAKVTRFEDDAIISGESMLLTFTNIGKDVFPDATKAMLDMSTAMGQDLKTTAIQLGKALNNPEEGLSALSRVGVKFTDEQKEMIKAMVAAGDIAGAQKIILQELQTEFGGSAEAAGNTFAGKLDILKNRVGEVQEAIGGALIPVLTNLIDQAIMPLMPELEKFATWFGEILAGGMQIPAALQPLVDAFGNLFVALQESAPMVQQALSDMWAFVQNTIAIVGPVIIENLSATINSIAALWSEHGDTVMAIVSFLWNTLVVVIGGTLTLITGIINAALLLIQGNWDGAWLAIQQTLVAFLDLALSLVGTTTAEFVRVWSTNWEMVKTITSTVLNNILSTIGSKVTQFIQVGQALIEGLRQGIKEKFVRVLLDISNWAAQIIAAVKRAFGMASPSKVFAEIGANLMIGMGEGIRGASHVPTGEAVAATQRVINNSYNLTINEAGSRGNVVSDFGLLKALAGA